MDNGIPELEIGLLISTGNAFGEITKLEDIFDAATIRILEDAKKIEAATSGGLGFANSSAGVAAFGNAAAAAEREAAKLRKEKNRLERESERLVTRLERQATVFGMGTAQIRAMDNAARATRLDDLGLTELAGRVRAATSEMERLETATNGVGGVSSRSRHSMMQFGMQMNDVATMAALGAPPMQIFASQAGQIVQVAQQAEGGVGGFAKQLGGLALRFAPLAVAAGAAYGGLRMVTSSLEDDAGLDAYVKSLGLTKEELAKLGDVGVSTGDVLTGVWRTIGADRTLDNFLTRAKGLWQDFQSSALAILRSTASGIYAGMAAAYRGTIDTWRQWPAAIGDLFYRGANASIAAINRLATGVNSVLGTNLFKQIKPLENAYAGAGSRVGNAYAKEFQRAYGEADAAFSQAGRNIIQASRERYKGMADTISAERRAKEAADAHKKSLDDQAKAAREAAAAMRELQTLYNQLQGRFDPVGAANRDYTETMASIRRLQSAGKISSSEAMDWQFAAGREAAEKAARAVKDVAIEIASLPKVTELDFTIKGLDALLSPSTNIFETIARDADRAAYSMERAFGRSGAVIGDTMAILAEYGAQKAAIDASTLTQAEKASETDKLRLNSTIAFTGAAKSLFAEHSRGYQAMAAAEKAMAAVQLARTAIDVAGGAAKMFAALGPFAFPAVAAMVGVMASFGFNGGKGSSSLAPSNKGTGTVFGNGTAESDSIRRALEAIREADNLTNTYARAMAGSLRSIESQIGGLAALVVRAGDVSASAGVRTGFQSDTTGKVLEGIVTGGGLFNKIPIVGGIIGGVGKLLGSLFGSTSTVVGNGLFGGPQSLGNILSGGFDASYYSDIEKKKKFLGITTGKSYSTKFGEADGALENQFTLILRSFSDAIAAAAGPLGMATNDVERRLASFVIDIGKVDLKGLSGTEIEEKLAGVFGAAADRMAAAAFPGAERFQQVGEGMFETLVRVASTAEAVTAALDQMGDAAVALSLEAKLGLAEQFDTIGDLTNAISAYFEAFYTPAEQLEARTEQLARVFDDLGFAIPDTLAAFRDLVDAQDLNTSAGQAAYATLIQLAPAFAEVRKAMAGAKSAADVATERADLERKLLELRGDTAALRALELGKLDASNRDLQKQIYALQDAKEAAAAADQLREAWQSVGAVIMEEVKRIRGITGAETGGFAALLGRFNAANAAARGGDLDAAKSLPQLSQALLTAAAEAATSRQELDRVRAQTASTLEATYNALGGAASATSAAALLNGASTAQVASTAPAANDVAASELREIRAELAALRSDNNAGHAATAGNTGRLVRKLDDVTAGGDALVVVQAA